MKSLLAAGIMVAGVAAAQTDDAKNAPEAGVPRGVLDGSAGAGFAIPLSGEKFPVLELATGAQVFLHPVFALALQLRASFPVVPGFRGGNEVGGALGVRVSLFKVFFLKALAGAGFSSACPRGDFCGGFGPTGTAELGAELGELAVRLTMIARLHAQLGMVNGVSAIVTPSLSGGLAW